MGLCVFSVLCVVVVWISLLEFTLEELVDISVGSVGYRSCTVYCNIGGYDIVDVLLLSAILVCYGNDLQPSYGLVLVYL